MGAGSITSNVKSDKTLVKVHGEDGDVETGLKKFGAMLGDCTLSNKITFLSSVEFPTVAPSPTRALPLINAHWRISASLQIINGPFTQAVGGISTDL